MNATKKISSILVLGAGAAMVLAGCAKSITRTDAEAVLDNIAVTVSKNYTAPTKLTETNKIKSGAVKTSVSSTGDFYFHSSYSGDYSISDYTGKVTFSAKDKAEAFAYKDGTSYVFGYTSDGATGSVYSTSDATAMNALISDQKTYVTSIIYDKTVSMSKYLKAFPEGTTPTTSGSIAAGSYMKSESYKSKGAGNLDENINVHYVKKTGEYDEVMQYTWDNNLLNLIKNDYDSSVDSFKWGSADTSKKVASSWTVADNAIAGALVITAAVALL
jgi:hypothetical protein